MPSASSQALEVSACTTIRRRRRLPVPGDILVAKGDWVETDQVVARAFVPGAFHPINAAAALALPPSDLPQAMRVTIGAEISRGDTLAETKTLFGWASHTVLSPIDGWLDSVSAVTGQLMLRQKPKPLELRAYLTGEVVAVEPGILVEIEAQVCQAQGIFGLSGEAWGLLTPVETDAGAPLTASMISAAHAGKVLLTKGRVSFEALEAMREAGVAGAVAASAYGAELMRFTGSGLNPAATGNERVGLTLVLTEGFGDIQMAERTHDLLSKLAGEKVAVSGTTQIRAGVIRPELVAPPLSTSAPIAEVRHHIATGDTVRIVRGEWFGRLGRVTGIPSELRLTGAGARALVFEMALDNGALLVVPRPNVELITFTHEQERQK